MPTRPYSTHRDRAARRQAELSRSGRDIGPLPPIADPARRVEGIRSLRRFCEIFGAAAFPLPWSADHLDTIAHLERIALRGGQKAIGLPRGFGKTTLCEWACIWAALAGHQPYLALIAATKDLAIPMLDSIKTELASNELLAADFPEVCFPIRALEGLANRCKGQLYLGRRTEMKWGSRRIILPTIPGSQASGVIIEATGLTGAVRGLHFKQPDGTVDRPTMAIVDDPQTNASATSPSQVIKRLQLLAADVMYLSGPGVRIAVAMPCTVIAPGDVADQCLDPQLHPEWHGHRGQLVYSWPTDMELWEEYARVLADELRAGGEGALATAFYAERREAMDAGGRVAWEALHDPEELSAIQHAMNLKLRDEEAFWSEQMNSPRRVSAAEEVQASPILIMSRVNGLPRLAVPTEARLVTLGVDVHDKLLYYVLAAWGDGFNGWILDYGAFPDQRRAYFTLRDARVALTHLAKGAGTEGAILAGLDSFLSDRLAAELKRDDGAVLKVERALCDSGYVSKIVYAVVRKRGSPALMPSKGRGVTASMKPISSYRRQPGWTIGNAWFIPSTKGTRELRHVVVDANFWKTFVHARLRTAPGDPGSLTLFGRRPEEHRMLADHVGASESATRTAGQGRVLWEWKELPAHPDNHLLDCLVLAAVGASMGGIAMAAETPVALPARRRHRRAFYADGTPQPGSEPPPAPPAPPIPEKGAQPAAAVPEPAKAPVPNPAPPAPAPRRRRSRVTYIA